MAAGVQDGAGCHGNPQTQQPLLEHRPPAPEPSRAQDRRTTSGSEAGPASLPPLLLGDPPDPAVPPTPDVDLLLECSFSYLQDGPRTRPPARPAAQWGGRRGDAAPPCGREDPLFHSTVSTLDPEASDEEEDIYRCSGAPPGGEPGYCRPGGSPGRPAEEDQRSPKGDQLAECWMGYPGPGCGILSLHVTDRYVGVWTSKGSVAASARRGSRWQRFEDNITRWRCPLGGLLWKVEQKTMTAYACGKVSIKGKRHWYKALELTASVALSNNAAWILRTNGDLYLQTGLSAGAPCARCVKGGAEQLLLRGGQLEERQDQRGAGGPLMCVSLAQRGGLGAGRQRGSVVQDRGLPRQPPGGDHHWWQISITDYVVFDQGSLFQTLLSGTPTALPRDRTPVERVAGALRVAFLSQQAQCHQLVSANPVCLDRLGAQPTPRRQGQPRGVSRGTSSMLLGCNLEPSGRTLFPGEPSPHHWTFITTSVLPYTAPVELSQLSACVDALWGLDTHGYVHIRTLSPTCPIGHALGAPGPQPARADVRRHRVRAGRQTVWPWTPGDGHYFSGRDATSEPQHDATCLDLLEPPYRYTTQH
ncbi:unnamed protein product [Boreogadus saida]